MEPGRDVVITGLGVVSPIGIGKHALWDSLCAQRSGVRPFERYSSLPLRVGFGAAIPDFDAKQYVQPRKSLKVMSREIQTGYAAASMAIAEADLADSALDPDRFGVVFGAEILHCDIDDLVPAYQACIENHKFFYDRWGGQGLAAVFPLWMLKYLPNMVACHIGIASDARGPNNTVLQGEATSLLAMIEAQRLIERGAADIVITGGTGSRISLTSQLYRGDHNLSHRNSGPSAASRPFDLGRDGMVIGEGAAALVLESREHAEARQARIIARITGCGRGFEATSSGFRPCGKGVAQSIRLALKEANIPASEVGFVKAHGISIPLDDRCEAHGIHSILPDTPVTAPKSFFGNLGAGGGAVEAVAAIMSLTHRQIPVTLNYEAPDPECPLDIVAREPRPLPQSTVLLLSQSDTGQAAAVLVSNEKI